jgi:RNA polymerase sigma-70 factor, ECF subfamily
MDDDEAGHRFTVMYDAHRNQVWAYTAFLAGRQRADDLVSETFVVAWRRFSDVPQPALPWLLGVARNVARNRIRAEGRQGSLESELHSWAGTATTAGPDELVATRLDVLRALAVLPAKDRELLILTGWEELTPHEAAAVVGVTPAVVRVRLHRARTRLRRTLNAAKSQAPHREMETAAATRQRLAREDAR